MTSLFYRFLYLFLSVSGILLLPSDGFGQGSDQFEDGNFTRNPAWQGDENDFIVNESHQLQLMAKETGTSYLSIPSKAIDQAEWTFYVALDFNPSAQNYAKIYLTSDQPNLSSLLNGYFVMIGGSEDEISLYKQIGKEIIKVIDGTDKRLDFDQVKATVKVSRTDEGEWTLWSAVGTELGDPHSFYKEGSAQDFGFLSSTYAGIVCQYTTTRKDKFYFDNFQISGNAFEDTVPPALIEVMFKTVHTLQLVFSEPLSAQPSQNFQNYALSPEIGKPEKAAIAKDSQNIVNITFKKPLKIGKDYTLTIESISDTTGNKTGGITKSFMFFLEREAHYREVVINELMVDPTPRIGLPETEFIELFNNSKSAFNLLGWQIADDKSEATLTHYRLLPEQFLILCAEADTALFQTYGHTMGIAPWPSLNNGAGSISLFNELGQIIDQVNYTDKWYKSSIREKGGYTLEMIDPLNPCSQEDNWKASESEFGGTPGQENTVFARKPDHSGPVLRQVFPKDGHTLSLFFGEGLDTATLAQAVYLINGKAIQATAKPNGLQNIALTLTNPLETGKSYALEIRKVKDCNGNYIEDGKNKVVFGLPEYADSADIILNEVLFNPRVDGVDFVEIYNNSDKYINLKNWRLANTSIEEETGRGIIDNRKLLTQQDFLFAPEALLVLTSSIGQTLKYYPKGSKENMLEMELLPTYPDEAGTVILLDQGNKTIDRFDYSEKYHSPILDEAEGVSLERISPNSPTQDPQNWTSAASTSGFATPGTPNTQLRRIDQIVGEITIKPKIISPNNDGANDFTTIQYFFRNQNYVAKILVFDAEGRRVRKIAANKTLGTSGFFTWEGIDDSFNKVKIGVYMLYIEIFNLNGTVKIFKEPIVVGGKL